MPAQSVSPRGHGAQVASTQLSPAAHALPQAPQFSGSRSVRTQLPPQSVRPPGQLPPPQVPAAQTSPSAHWLKQAPQWFRLLSVL